VKIKIKKLFEDAIVPSYAHEGDAGMDVYSRENYILKAGEKHRFSTGISSEIPDGIVALIWDKSGLAAENGLTVLAGVIDSGYRGEWMVVLLNSSREDYRIKKGDKIAQALIQSVYRVEVEVAGELSSTKRGAGGFGSTGRK